MLKSHICRFDVFSSSLTRTNCISCFIGSHFLYCATMHFKSFVNFFVSLLSLGGIAIFHIYSLTLRTPFNLYVCFLSIKHHFGIRSTNDKHLSLTGGSQLTNCKMQCTSEASPRIFHIFNAIKLC